MEFCEGWYRHFHDFVAASKVVLDCSQFIVVVNRKAHVFDSVVELHFLTVFVEERG
jgi:hypothetical protein